MVAIENRSVISEIHRFDTFWLVYATIYSFCLWKNFEIKLPLLSKARMTYIPLIVYWMWLISGDRVLASNRLSYTLVSI